MVHIDIHVIPNSRTCIGVETNWLESQQVGQIPGSKFSGTRWLLPLSWGSLIALRGMFGQGLTMSDGIRDWAWKERHNRVDPSNALRALLEPNDEYPCKGYDDRLYDFQKVGSEFLISGCDTLLCDEMGLGKTVQALTALRRTGLLPAVVICPNSVKDNWAREIEIWYPEAEPIVIKGSQRVKSDQFARAMGKSNAIVIINIEAVRLHSRLARYGSIRLTRCRACDPRFGDPRIKKNRCEVHPKELNYFPAKTVIIDEAHCIKDPKSKQTRACYAVMHQESVMQRIAMTGTPIANSPIDLWSLLHAISKDEFMTRSKFIDRYCLTSWNARGGLDVIGIQPNMRGEFDTIVNPRMRRTPKALVLPQLPRKVRTYRYVDMTPRQKKAYNELDQMMLTWLGDQQNVLTAASHLARRTRLMQLASSYADVTYEDDGDWQTSVVSLRDPSPKVDELLEIIEEMGDKSLVVAAEQRKLIELAAARLDKENISYVLITGKISQIERTANLQAFQDGKVRVLLFTIKAGGTGLTMTRADTIVFLQRSDSMVDNLQAEDRVHRIGSEGHESVQVISIVTRDTVEVDQITRLSAKFERLDEITQDRARLGEAGIDLPAYDAQEQQIMSYNVFTDTMEAPCRTANK